MGESRGFDEDDETLPIIQSRSSVVDSSLNHKSNSPPIWTWFLLTASILAVSSAGAVFATMPEVPPLLIASWRLQATSIILIIAATIQWNTTVPPNIKQDTKDNIKLLAISGTSLAIHFATWVASLQLTSLTHSLLFVCSTPILLSAYSLIRRLPISMGEIGGAVLGFIGTLLLASSARSEQQVTLLGDFLALTASAAFIPYLLIGKHLRKWMPLFIYASIVTTLAAVELGCASIPIEGSFFFGKESRLSTFGYLTNLQYALRIGYLGIVPGLVGHTGINALLAYLNPLIITLTLNMEPLLGSILGFFMGVSSPPSLLTYIGGCIILISTAVVSVSTQQREESERQQQNSSYTSGGDGIVIIGENNNNGGMRVEMTVNNDIPRVNRVNDDNEKRLKHKYSGVDIHDDDDDG